MIRAFSNNNRKGFTLVELLVSIAIFVIFLGVVSVSYIGIVRSQRQANEVRKMYSDVRAFVESLSQDMRLGTIDYECYSDPLSSTPSTSSTTCPFSTIVDPSGTVADASPYLAIVNRDHTRKVVYWFDKDKNKLRVIRYELANGGNGDLVGWNPVQGYAPGDEAPDSPGGRTLLSDLVKVASVTFSVNPAVDPYTSDHYDLNQVQFQPKVTMTMTVVNSDKTVTPFHLDFQTTLSSRVYSRFKS